MVERYYLGNMTGRNINKGTTDAYNAILDKTTFARYRESFGNYPYEPKLITKGEEDYFYTMNPTTSRLEKIDSTGEIYGTINVGGGLENAHQIMYSNGLLYSIFSTGSHQWIFVFDTDTLEEVTRGQISFMGPVGNDKTGKVKTMFPYNNTLYNLVTSGSNLRIAELDLKTLGSITTYFLPVSQGSYANVEYSLLAKKRNLIFIGVDENWFVYDEIEEELVSQKTSTGKKIVDVKVNSDGDWACLTTLNELLILDKETLAQKNDYVEPSNEYEINSKNLHVDEDGYIFVCGENNAILKVEPAGNLVTSVYLDDFLNDKKANMVFANDDDFYLYGNKYMSKLLHLYEVKGYERIDM